MPAVVALLVFSTAQVVDALLGTDLLDVPPMLLLVAASAYAVGRLAHRGVTASAVAVAAVSLTWAGQTYAPTEYAVLDDLVFYLLVAGGPAVAGAVVRARAAQVQELRRVAGLLAVQREEAARAAELKERNRVEIGLHRGFSEQVAAIVMRMEGARAAGPEELAHALADVEAASRHTLQDLRHALGTLRDSTPLAAPSSSRPPPPGPPRRPLDWRDGLVALGCGIAVGIEVAVSPSTQGSVTANVLTGLAVASPLVLRRVLPVPASLAFLTGVAVMSHWLTPWTVMVTTILPMLVAAYSIGAHARSWQRYVGLAVVLLGPAAVMAAVPAAAREPDGLAPTIIWLALAFGAGVASAGWSLRAAELRRVVAELERGRDIHVQRAVEEERNRLARELHDTVAHSMTVICLQAAAGQAAATDTATTILTAARAALDELRAGLDQLDHRGALEPEEIRARARAAGLRPEVRVVGDLEDLPEEVRALAGRLLREALVNAGRYAAGARVVVDVVVDDQLRIDVVNDAGAETGFQDGAGTGLGSLIDEVTRCGGTLRAGPRHDGGWQVSATLPRQEVLV